MKSPEEIVDEQCAALEEQYLKPGKIRLYTFFDGSPDEYKVLRDWDVHPTEKQKRKVEIKERARNLLHDARTCNPAHLSHGINSGISQLEWALKEIGQGREDMEFYDRLNKNCLELAGFLYLLKYSK